MLWGYQPIILRRIAEQFRDNTFDEFAEGVFECNGAICFGFGVIWLSWFPNDNRGGCFEGGREVRDVDGRLGEGMEVLGCCIEGLLQ